MITYTDKYFLHQKIDLEKIEKLYGKNFSPLVANLLFVRGIKTKLAAENFLNPKWSDNFNPFLFQDMEKIVQRIWQAVEKKEKILIFSDYDTDGIPGGVILHDFFKKINYQNFENFIPNRNKDGYGLSKNVVKNLVEKNKPDLVITVDCGITDVESANYLQENDIDLIITDHHLPNGKIPVDVGILNHQVEDEKYPEKILSGAGIAFKLVQALFLKKPNSKELSKVPDEWEKWLLDLVVIATICDMVPLVGENRLFVKYGKIVLDKTSRVGLKKIIELARLNKRDISTNDVGFMIGPRINAAARLEDPRIAFDALAGNQEQAIFSANELEKINNRRKYLTAKIMKEVWKKLEKRAHHNKVIVIGNKDWPLGVVGLIAGKIADKYQKPAFVWSEITPKPCLGVQSDTKKEPLNNTSLKGSCRSGGKYSVFSLMEKTKKEFLKFGGHQHSGGFEIDFNKIHSLEEKLSKKLNLTEKIQNVKTIIDQEISLDDVNMATYQNIKKLEPFGVGNQKPLFLIKNQKIFRVNYFGKNKEHLELIFQNSKKQNIKAISFYFQDNFQQEFASNQSIDLVCSYELNSWNGNSYLRLKIEDIV